MKSWERKYARRWDGIVGCGTGMHGMQWYGMGGMMRFRNGPTAASTCTYMSHLQCRAKAFGNALQYWHVIKKGCLGVFQVTYVCMCVWCTAAFSETTKNGRAPGFFLHWHYFTKTLGSGSKPLLFLPVPPSPAGQGRECSQERGADPSGRAAMEKFAPEAQHDLPCPRRARGRR